jgi:hypothetical protein
LGAALHYVAPWLDEPETVTATMTGIHDGAAALIVELDAATSGDSLTMAA